MAGAFFYMDTDAGSDANNGLDWVAGGPTNLPKLTFEGAYAVMAAGDILFVQGTAADDVAGARTWAGPGTGLQPVVVIGVADGTTRTGTSIIPADLASTLPVLSTSGGDGDITISGHFTFINMEISDGDRPVINAPVTLIDCTYRSVDRWTINDTMTMIGGVLDLNDTVVTQLATGLLGNVRLYGVDIQTGGNLTSGLFRSISSGGKLNEFYGCDLSDFGANELIQGTGAGVGFRFANCIMPNAAFTLYGAAPDGVEDTFIELIGCQFAGATSNLSIPAYEYQGVHGTIDVEATKVRTGGASDGSTGAFSYRMLAAASSVIEGSGACLKSPPILGWTDGTVSQTFKVFVAGDGAAALTEEQLWLELYTPSTTDSPMHDLSITQADERKLRGATAITADTSDTWAHVFGAGSDAPDFAYELAITITPGYAGPVYGRVCLAKNQATPDSVYVDPRIEVT